MRGHHVLRVERRLHPEAAADVADQHAHAVGRDAEDLAGELVAQAGRRLARHAQREAARRGVVRGECRARLERARREALVRKVERDHVRRRGEGRGRRLRVAVALLARDVAGGRRPDEGRVGDEGVGERGHRGQRLVAYADGFRGVARLHARFRDDRGHGLADVADRVDGERALRRPGGRRAVGTLEVGGLDERLHAGAHEVRAGDDREHAGQRHRRRGVERGDARVRVRRAHEDDVRLPGQREVVGEPAAAGEERVVLHAAHGAAAAEAGVLGGVGHGRDWG